MTTTSTPAALIDATITLAAQAIEIHGLTPEQAVHYVLARMAESNFDVFGRVLAAIPTN